MQGKKQERKGGTWYKHEIKRIFRGYLQQKIKFSQMMKYKKELIFVYLYACKKGKVIGTPPRRGKNKGQKPRDGIGNTAKTQTRNPSIRY